MRVIEKRLGRIAMRRWSDGSIQGFSVAMSLPRDTLRKRFRDITYAVLRRHPEVAFKDAQVGQYRDAIDVLEGELDDFEENYRASVVVATRARWDAQMIYDHAQEIVEIVHRYQGSLNTLSAPDPHEARVRFVIDNFFKQFKDRYDRCG